MLTNQYLNQFAEDQSAVLFLQDESVLNYLNV